MMEDLFIEFQSKYSVDQTVKILIEEIENGDWKVQIIHDLQHSLANKEYDVLPIKVIELCNPHHSSKILSRDEERIYANLMPCRIAVYDKADGKTSLSLMNAGVLSKTIGGVVEEVMGTAFVDSMKFTENVRR